MPQLPTVAIIGIVNVGKSTLFNCLAEEKKALASRVPRTTRDRNYTEIKWRGKKFVLVDTGGIVENSHLQTADFKTTGLEKEVMKQTKTALDEADLILFMVDGRNGVLPQDRQLARNLEKNKKPLLVVVNKIDNEKLRSNLGEFFKLGLGEPLAISALHGLGTGDLLDEIVNSLKYGRGRPPQEKQVKGFKIAIIGKPNVGKSSLLNALLKEKRVVVSPLPHTTREPQDSLIYYQEEPLVLIDTAGIRKKIKIKNGLIKAGITKSLEVLKKSDLALLIVDASEPLTTLDKHLADLILQAGVGLIIVVNKWDMERGQKEDKMSTKEYEDYLRRHFPFLSWAPVVFISALTGWGVQKIFDLALGVRAENERKIPEKALERLLKKIVKKHKPAGQVKVKKGQIKPGRFPYIHKLEQTDTAPLEFTVILGRGHSLAPHYLRFIENELRRKFGFKGAPVKIKSKN